MTVDRRSEDDLPLAAYARRGAVDSPDDPLEPSAIAPEATQQAPVVSAAADAAPAGGHPSGPAPGPFAAPGAPMGDAPTVEDESSVPQRRAGLAGAAALARRNPRVAAGAGFVAVIVFGLVLLGGGKPAPSAAGSVPSAGTPTTAPPLADPGSASLVLTGSVQATFTLTGNPGTPVSTGGVSATWADSLQNVLTLDGPVDRGTRTTDASLVMTLGLMIDGRLVTFTSKAGECTIGMASTPKAVSGSFSCRKLKSDDGKLTVGASGTYRT